MGQQTILLVEDDAGFAYAVWRHFEANGYRVVSVDSAMAALEQWESNRIDIVIADIHLSSDGPNGILLSQMIKHESGDIPIILLTGYPNLAHDQNDLPGRVIYKPVELSSLQQVVEHSLAA